MDEFNDLMTPKKSEIVIGIVAPVGCDLALVRNELNHCLELYGYKRHEIRLSNLIKQEALDSSKLVESSYEDRLHSYMEAGNEIKKGLRRGDALALYAIAQIDRMRDDLKPEGKEMRQPLPGHAFILSSLKHPEEVHTLRSVYGSGFILLGVSHPRPDLREWLKATKGVEKPEELIERDESERVVVDCDGGEQVEVGQSTRKTFELSDAFLPMTGLARELQRVMKIVFGHPHMTPTLEEHAMFMAYASALRSGDLSRQVGAVVTSERDEIIGVGANDVPRAGGGLYWAGHAEIGDQRDHVIGHDANEKQRDEIIHDCLIRLDLKIDVEEAKRKLKGGGLMAITEFGRAVHAEMDALLSSARSGASPRGGNLYCTTFPCHNCAKHIVAAGIATVVYIEPYPKSQALDLHGDSIAHIDGKDGAHASAGVAKVNLRPFVGIGPRKFVDFFAMAWGNGTPLVRKRKGLAVRDWTEGSARPRVPLAPTTYMDREILVKNILQEAVQNDSATKSE